MLADWWVREGGIILQWWLLVTLAGAAVFPLSIRLFRGLPDRGYTLARAAGLLLVAFVYWILASLGFLENSTGGMLLAWLLVLALSLTAYVRLRDDSFRWRDFWRENQRVIVIAEVLFIVLLASWTVYRAFQNDTGSTEKPMELTFISGIMRSDSFPPNDPWLAGYAISYYYFGYLMAAMLSMLSGVSSGIGFSMTIATWFALTGLTVFGVGYNLVRSRVFRWGQHVQNRAAGHGTALLTGVLALVFVLLLGNFQLPLIELPYRWQSAPAEYFDFWGTQDRTALGDSYQQGEGLLTGTTPLTHPREWTSASWWWFRASRVLTDYELDGTVSTHAQVIDEFPAFSFVLADAHPHVLALPFVVLAIGLALNIVLTGRAPNRYEILLYGLVVGGLTFLNTWDGPIYLALLGGAEALRRTMQRDGRLLGEDWLGILRFGAALVAIALVAYLPFLVGFRSQAAGFLPNLLYPTLFRRFFIMMGPLLIPVLTFLGVEAWRGRGLRRMNWSLGIQVALGFLAVLLGGMVLLTLLAALIPSLQQAVDSFILRQGGWDVVLPALLQRRLTHSLTSVVLLVGIALVVARLFPRGERGADAPDKPSAGHSYPAATGFALLLVGLGFSLMLVPDFIYLRDNFSTRINTVFKFYYQAWIVLSLVSAYAVYSVLLDRWAARPAASVRGVFAVVLVLVVGVGLLYPVFAVYSRAMIETGYYAASAENPPQLTLDGTRQMPLTVDDYNAIQCLSNQVSGDDVVVAEAVLMAYRSHYGRVAAITGLPIVIGWENHERQWRGPTYDATAGNRAADVNELFTDLRWDFALEIIERYDIDYVFYGATERQQYGAMGEDKFLENAPVVCEYGETRVYRVDGTQ